MPIFKVTFAFFQRKQGWSESYYLDQSSSSNETAMQNAIPLAIKRRALSGQETTLDAIRVSREGLDADSFLNYVGIPAANLESSDEPSTALLVRMSDGDHSQYRQMYLRGIYDGMVFPGGSFNNQYPAFMQNWPGYVQELTVKPWGWMAVNRETRKKVDLQGYSVNNVDLVTFTTKANVFPEDVLDKVVTVRLSGINRGSELNGAQKVLVLGPRSCQTIYPCSPFPYKTGGELLFSKPAFAKFVHIQPQKIVNRKVGAPLLASRGRRPARARG